MKFLPEPEIEWQDDGTPRSVPFDDIYFVPSEGMVESRHVFLAGADVVARWQSKPTFTIFETGFGTGLNFLTTWAEWDRRAAKDGHLHFVSVEGFPLVRKDLERALAPYDELSKWSAELIRAYPERHPGFHRLSFGNARVTLTLILGSLEDAISKFDGKVDAWFLDGFAPTRNPDMWTSELFEMMSKHSNTDARVATFSVAGNIRRGLEGVD